MEGAYISTTKKSKKVTFTKNVYIYIFNIDDFDVNKILVSKNEPYVKNNSLKYFIGYNDNDVIGPLCLRLSKMTGYINKFDNTKIKRKKNNNNAS